MSLAVVSGLLAVMTLGACSPVTPDDKNIVSFTGANGETINISTDLYGDYSKNVDAVKAYYNALTEALIRNYMANPARSSVLAEIRIKAKNRVEDIKAQAQTNKEANGTSYDEEFEKLLENYKCKDEDELYEYFSYQFMSEEVKDTYFDDAKLKELLTKVDDGYLDKMVPYHVKHILVKVDAKSTSWYDGEITSSQAKKLSTVARELKDGVKFGNIAKRNSEDEGSAANFGDLGIMSKATGFVNEFKLGLYTYDLLFKGNEQERIIAKDRIGVEDSVIRELKAVLNDSIGKIPYGVFERLSDYAEEETHVNELGYKITVNKGQHNYYPRNVLYNKWLNRHNISIITPDDIAIRGVSATGAFTDEENYVGDGSAVYDNSSFRTIEINGVPTKALCDEYGRVILVARAGSSYEGIHFMTVERSYFEETVGGVSREDYYTWKIPGEDGFPKTPEGNDKITYVNINNSDAATYKERATAVEDEIRGYDKTIDDKMFKWLCEPEQNPDVKFVSASFKASLDTYIENNAANIALTADEEFKDAWDSYLRTLEIQKDMRGEGTTDTRLISDTCAILFAEEGVLSPAYTNEQGGCYYDETHNK